MEFPQTPSPCPDLKPGLALGAPDHQGFVATWNWIVGVFRKAKEHFVFSLGGLTGDIEIEGAEIDAEENKIKITGGGGLSGSFSYDEENKRIRDGVVMIGRSPVLVGGVAATDGPYRVKVTFTETGGKTCDLEPGDGFGPPQDLVSYIPVYVLEGGKVVADYRGAFVVPAYDV